MCNKYFCVLKIAYCSICRLEIFECDDFGISNIYEHLILKNDKEMHKTTRQISLKMIKVQETIKTVHKLKKYCFKQGKNCCDLHKLSDDLLVSLLLFLK